MLGVFLQHAPHKGKSAQNSRFTMCGRVCQRQFLTWMQPAAPVFCLFA